ncbi:MAG: acetyltransferase [Gemmatimonadales bacterium]
MDEERQPLLVYGSGEHAAVVTDAVERSADVRVGGVCDDNPDRLGVTLLGHTVGAPDDFPRDWPVVVAIGDNENRARCVAKFETWGRRFAGAVVHPGAIVSPHASLGAGTVVMAGAIVNPRAVIGRHAIVNTAASVDHDCDIGDFAHVSVGVHLAGRVSVGAFSLIGVGAAAIPQIRIGSRAVVGAGAVVIRDVPDGAVVAGNPARPLDRG